MTVHQCAQLCNDLSLVHERAIRHIANYLASTSTYVYLPDGNQRLFTRGVFYKPNKEKSIECYLYAKFPSGCAQADAAKAENVMLRMEYVITYVVCPVLW